MEAAGALQGQGSGAWSVRVLLQQTTRYLGTSVQVQEQLTSVKTVCTEPPMSRLGRRPCSGEIAYRTSESIKMNIITWWLQQKFCMQGIDQEDHCMCRCWQARGFVSRLKHLGNPPSRPDISGRSRRVATSQFRPVDCMQTPLGISVIYCGI